MAGTPRKTKPVAAKVINQATRNRRRENAQAYGELVRLAAENRIEYPGGSVTAVEVLQELLDRSTGNWRWAAGQLDLVPPSQFWVQKVDAQGNVLVEPCKWYQLERAAASEVERLAGMMVQLDIDERHVRVEEARAVLVVAAVRDAARDAGLEPAQVQRLGASLRKRLEVAA
jgi:hypothetical protein